MKTIFNLSTAAFLILFTLVTTCTHAQDQSSKDELKLQNEISLNLLDLVIAGTLNFNFEHHFKNNQSLWIAANLFDTYGYYDAGYIDENNAFSFQGAYIIYFSSKKDHTGFFFYPLAKYRFGEITVDDGFYYFDENEVQNLNYTYDIDGFSLGFGLGYKWVFSNRFALTLTGQVARNLGSFEDDYLSNVEPRFGVNFGYRF